MATPTAKHRVREAKAALYRELLLESAEQIFGEQGFDASRMQDVARAAGVSLSTLYGIFPGKLDLFTAIHDRRIAELMTLSGQMTARCEGVLALMLAGISAYIRFHIEHPSYLRMNVHEGSSWSTGHNLRSENQARTWSRGFKMLASAFQQGIADRVFSDDDTPQFMARTLLAMHQVRLADWLESANGPALGSTEIVARVQRQFVRTFCRPELVALTLDELRSHGRYAEPLQRQDP